MRVAEIHHQLDIARGQLRTKEAQLAKARADRSALINVDHPLCRSSIEIFDGGARRGEGIPPHFITAGYTDRWEGLARIEQAIREWQDKEEWLTSQLPSAEEIAAAERWVVAQVADMTTNDTQLDDALRRLHAMLNALAPVVMEAASLQAEMREADARLTDFCNEHDLPRPQVPFARGIPAVCEPLGLLFTHGLASDAGLFAHIRALLPKEQPIAV